MDSGFRGGSRRHGPETLSFKAFQGRKVPSKSEEMCLATCCPIHFLFKYFWKFTINSLSVCAEYKTKGNKKSSLVESCPLVQSKCGSGSFLLCVSVFTHILWPFQIYSGKNFSFKTIHDINAAGMRLGGRIFTAQRHFHINYKSICIIYRPPIKVKVTDLALNVLGSLINSFHMHYIFSVKVFNAFGKSRR